MRASSQPPPGVGGWVSWRISWRAGGGGGAQEGEFKRGLRGSGIRRNPPFCHPLVT